MFPIKDLKAWLEEYKERSKKEPYIRNNDANYWEEKVETLDEILEKIQQLKEQSNVEKGC